jgi:hypothetical protein
MAQYLPTPEDYERERRWLEQYRHWALPVAGGLGFIVLALSLWAIWQITAAIL